eukprot:scaffold657_cov214-Amphora_coffeaeformis.AAC.7
MCSGTLVEGAKDRAIISTAGHCVYDVTAKSFPDKVIFIPGQDDGEGDGTDQNCANDPHGCFYPTVGVISGHYQSSGFLPGLAYDYGFYVAPDTDPSDQNGPDRGTYRGPTPYHSLTPMGISFKGVQNGNRFHLFGYPGSRDPQFMYTHGRAEEAPIKTGGNYVGCSGLTGGASGGPWTTPFPLATGRLVVTTVNSWGWGNEDPGIGAPPFNTGGAECVYKAALKANVNGNHVVANCPQ